MLNQTMVILNIIFSSQEKCQSILSVHRAVGEALLSDKRRVINLFLTGEPAEASAFPGNNEYWRLDVRLVRCKGVLNKLKYQLLVYRLLQFIKKNNISMVVCDGISSITLLCRIQQYLSPAAIGIFHGAVTIKPREERIIRKQVHLWQFVAVSAMVKSKLLSSNSGITEKNTSIIHNAIDFQKLKRFSYNSDTAREKLNIDKKKFVFGITGRLVRGKSHEVIIDAVYRLKEKQCWPDSALVVIIGDGERKAFLEKKIYDAGLKNDFLFTGWVNNASWYTAAFDVFIMASTALEGFGIALLEGCAAKLPVIASDVDIFRQIAGNHAHYFPVNDVDALSGKMLNMVAISKSERMKAGQNIYDHVHQYFDINKFKLSYLTLSDKVTHRSTFIKHELFKL